MMVAQQHIIVLNSIWRVYDGAAEMCIGPQLTITKDPVPHSIPEKKSPQNSEEGKVTNSKY